MQKPQLRYVIKFVSDMGKAVRFYRDAIGLQLKFESPGWSEFATGETILTLHLRLCKQSCWHHRVGVQRCRCRGFLSGHERKRGAVHDATDEAGFRWSAGTVHRFRRRTLQRRHGVNWIALGSFALGSLAPGSLAPTLVEGCIPLGNSNIVSGGRNDNSERD